MAPDCRGNKRGRCLACTECKEFESWDKNIRCAYCDCPPTKHEYSVKKETYSNLSEENYSTNDDIATAQAHHTSEEVATEVNEENIIYVSPSQESPALTGQEGCVENGIQEGGSDRTASVGSRVDGNGSTQPERKLVKSLKCPICQKGFSKAHFLKSHLLLHKGKKHFKCSTCHVVYQDLNKLLKHKSSHKRDTMRQDMKLGRISHQKDTKQANLPQVPFQSTSNSSEVKRKESVSAKRPKFADGRITSIAPKQANVPSFQNGFNVWSSPAQNGFLMSPLSSNFVSQMAVPQAQILQQPPVNPLNRGFQGLQGSTMPQGQGFLDSPNSLNQKILSLLQLVDTKMSSLNQLDRKLDLILHCLNVPRQSLPETQHFTIESDVSQLGNLSQSVEQTGQSPQALSQSYHERIEFQRGSFDPYQPIPDDVLDEVYKASVSRRNLAKNLVFLLFSADELRGRNCAGKVYGKGEPKQRLNQAKLQAVKIATFKKYPCDLSQVDLIWQRECVKAIDKAIRSRALSNKL